MEPERRLSHLGDLARLERVRHNLELRNRLAVNDHAEAPAPLARPAVVVLLVGILPGPAEQEPLPEILGALASRRLLGRRHRRSRGDQDVVDQPVVAGGVRAVDVGRV